MFFRTSTVFVLLTLVGAFASAQELSPRAYQPGPVGLNALTLNYTHSFGDIVFEPSFPAKDVDASLHLESAGYYRSLDFLGRFANLTLSIPYAAGHLNGTVEGLPREIYRSGLGDARVRFAVNLKGTPAMTMGEFLKHRQEANIGVSLHVSAPTGQYDSAKVINIGQNRWAFKPELAITKLLGKWQIDAYGGVWFFTRNSNFLGSIQTQSPVPSFQFHLTYNFPKGYWLGLNSNFYSGGRTTINGVRGTTDQRNSRIGATLSVPVARNQSFKFAVSRGAFITRGGNFTSLGVAYNYAWGAKK